MVILYVLLGLVGLAALLVLALLLMMRRNLPWPNSFAVFSNLKVPFPAWLRDWVQGGPRDYASLPPVLVANDGTPVETQRQFEARRAELLALFEEHVYGPLPREGFGTSFRIVEEGETLDGTALRRQVKVTVTTSKGSREATLLLYLPKAERPVPVVIGLNFHGNHTVLADPAILPSCSADPAGETYEADRGKAEARWNIARSVARGYAVATMAAGDWAPDHKERYASGIISLFDEPEFKAVGAWAFGLMRGMDYLAGESAIDHSHIAVVGHSRLGKAATWAGACDTRIGLVLSNDSGNSGASLSRQNRGETVRSITTGFPYWFSSRYAAYADREAELPVDQHMLLAAIAPRRVYVACAQGDLWADPRGAWNSLQFAKPAFRLCWGEDVLPQEGADLPEVGKSYVSPSMGFHIRPGWHDITLEDWDHYLAYMDRYFR